VEGSCEHGNETSGCMKCREILEKLSDWWLLKNGSAQRSWSVQRPTLEERFVMNGPVPLAEFDGLLDRT
jgi:hypothetical protein